MIGTRSHRIIAGATKAATVFISVRVRLCVFVTMRAMRFLSVLFASLASTNILQLRDRFHVSPIHATSDTAKMIQLKALRNWTHKVFVRNYVGYPEPFVCGADSDHAVSVINVERTSPKPASAVRLRGNKGHESFNKGTASILTFGHVILLKSVLGAVGTFARLSALSYFPTLRQAVQ